MSSAVKPEGHSAERKAGDHSSCVSWSTTTTAEMQIMKMRNAAPTRFTASSARHNPLHTGEGRPATPMPLLPGTNVCLGRQRGLLTGFRGCHRRDARPPGRMSRRACVSFEQ